ncbi:hypothetical protein CRG98_003693 [Punica granatum]|uniref:Uncharacterized protein n=1 Tax=Punica granatum TaxID=22663 RepID=A0A2I0L5L5_PUNGR|nr:hypothetical protein CRG98_003693 [Punica granatum]
MRDPQSLGNSTQPTLREKATPINRYSPDKSDCQPTRLDQFEYVHSRGQNRLPEPIFSNFLGFSRIPGLGIIIPDLEKLRLLRSLCVCGAIRWSMTDSHASLCFYVFLHHIMHVFIVYSACMSRNSLNHSRGDLASSGKPKEPLGLVRTRMWTLVGARIVLFWIARLGGVHLPVGTRDGHA